MREKIFAVLGFYLPSFFKMKINTPESLIDLNALSDIDLAIYFHEYIHYTQDISTTFGLMNMCMIVDYLKFACHEVLSSRFNTFVTPICPKPKAPDNVHANFELRKIYQGSLSDLDNVTIQSVKKLHYNIDFLDETKKVPFILVEYDKSFHSTNNFLLGARCIKESMAYLAQSITSPISIPVTQIPYLSAVMVVQKIYPLFSKNRLNIFALCDAALGAYHPGLFFFDMLIKMKSESWLPTGPEDVYVYCSNKEFYSGTPNSLQNLLINTSKEAIKQLNDWFTADIFEDNQKWAEYTIKTAVNLRLTNPSFVLDIVKKGHLKKNSSFSDIIKVIGIPMATNQAYEGTFFNPIIDEYNLRPELFWVISQIFKIFMGGPKNCELKFFCQACNREKNIPDYTDLNCDNSPWEKAEIDPLCPFGQVWRMWGLSNKKPQ